MKQEKLLSFEERFSFTACALMQRNGLMGALLYPNKYPFFCCQAIRVRDTEELERLRGQFAAKHLPIYLPQNGDKTLLVVQTSGTSYEGLVEITAENHAQVYEEAKKLFQFAADWCSEHPEIFSAGPFAVPIS